MKEGISVVVSSHLTSQQNHRFVRHLQKQAGVPLDVQIYSNFNEISLSEVYDRGLREAIYERILFVHNDVKIKTRHWGRKLLDHFSRSSFGILGVAGTSCLQNGCWWQDRRFTLGQVEHYDPSSQRRWNSAFSPDFRGEVLDAVALDGVFIAVDKSRIRAGFNTQFPGFHFYDLSFCVDNYLAGVKVGVIFDVKITHESVGQVDEAWQQNKLLFEEIYDKHFPLRQMPDLIFSDADAKIQSPAPKVAVLVLSKNANQLLENLLESFREYCLYPNYRIVIGDTGSEEGNYPDEKLLEPFRRWGIDLEVVDLPMYHFAGNYNQLVTEYTTHEDELILFCNNDIELVNDALGYCVQAYQQAQNCGTVGARLHYANHTVQHNGMLIAVRGGRFVITHRALHSDYQYQEGVFPVVGNTAGFMLVERTLFQEVGGFDQAYQECFEDVAFNIRCLQLGRKNLQNGDAVALHLESLSRKARDGRQEREYQDIRRLTEMLNRENVYYSFLQVWDS